eukprot:scaffold87524_cov60-Phaeocystis_antarctica.AAC.1
MSRCRSGVRAMPAVEECGAAAEVGWHTWRDVGCHGGRCSLSTDRRTMNRGTDGRVTELAQRELGGGCK